MGRRIHPLLCGSDESFGKDPRPSGGRFRNWGKDRCGGHYLDGDRRLVLLVGIALEQRCQRQAHDIGEKQSDDDAEVEVHF